MFVDYIHFPQNLASPLGKQYLETEYRRVLGNLEERSGRRAAAEDLNRSIALYNRIRGSLRELYRIRAESPHLVSAAESFVLARAGTLMAPKDHLEMLQQVLAAIPGRPARPKDRIRVVLEGSFCELPPLALIETLEEAGCYILDDDFLRGWRWFTSDVPVQENPRASNEFLNMGTTEVGALLGQPTVEAGCRLGIRKNQVPRLFFQFRPHNVYRGRFARSI